MHHIQNLTNQWHTTESFWITEVQDLMIKYYLDNSKDGTRQIDRPEIKQPKSALYKKLTSS